LPILTLQDEARRREGRILRELPDALNPSSLCVEAGLTLDQAWAHYLEGREPHPWSEELSLVVRQVQAGSSRKDALAALSQRLDLTDVSLFVSSVTHAERTGTGVGATLRRLGATLRDKQTQRAEKAVQELPVKLLLPLLLCVMPSPCWSSSRRPLEAHLWVNTRPQVVGTIQTADSVFPSFAWVDVPFSMAREHRRDLFPPVVHRSIPVSLGGSRPGLSRCGPSGDRPGRTPQIVAVLHGPKGTVATLECLGGTLRRLD
jgi:hypothetical protein